METVIKDGDKILLVEIFKKFKHFKVTYIDASRKKMLEWYNRASGRNVCIRTLDYKIARLKNAFMMGRQSRTKDMGELGRQFDTSMTFILPAGLSVLEYMGYEAFDIMKRLRNIVKPRKKKARREEAHRAQSGSTVPMGEVIKEIMNKSESS